MDKLSTVLSRSSIVLASPFTDINKSFLEISQRGDEMAELIPKITPEDIANAVTFLCSAEARYITGQNLCVDGGRSLGLHGD